MSLSAYTTRRQLPLLLDSFDNIIRKHALQNYLPQELNIQKALYTMLVTFSSLSWPFCPQNLSKWMGWEGKNINNILDRGNSIPLKTFMHWGLIYLACFCSWCNSSRPETKRVHRQTSMKSFCISRNKNYTLWLPQEKQWEVRITQLKLRPAKIGHIYTCQTVPSGHTHVCTSMEACLISRQYMNI